jgi:antagonist of KipI
MSATLSVLLPGLHTLVVDHGRPRTRGLGVPIGGAADRLSLAVGNALVGNPPGAAALEVALAGPTLVSDAPLACVLFGAPFVLKTDRRPLEAGTTFTLEPGEALSIGGTPRRARAYLCVRGGVEGPLVLGSRSGLAPLRAGDRLTCHAGRVKGRSLRLPEEPVWFRERFPPVLTVMPGPQADWFPPFALLGDEMLFCVSPASDRMGLRLQGPALPVPAREMVSEPVCPGTVQVTRDGQCIILGVDGQTIGGYPRVAQVVSAHLEWLGQLRPGERIRFEYATLDEAEALARQREATLRRWLTRLEVTRDG